MLISHLLIGLVSGDLIWAKVRVEQAKLGKSCGMFTNVKTAREREADIL